MLSVASLLLAVSTVLAAPAPPTDLQVLQYALTLEHLEHSFYDNALGKYDADAFAAAGFPDWVRPRFQQIANHEKEHVDFLSAAIGASATKPCQYSFPDTDPQSFAAVATILEGVGTSAYLGAAQFLDNKQYLTIAGSILTTEARHAAWINSAARPNAAWSGPFDVPLGLSQVYSLAAPFIVPNSCPSTNPALPITSFPSLSIASGSPTTPGSQATLEFSTTEASELWAAFLCGLDIFYAKIDSQKNVIIPEGVDGTCYVVVTSSGTMVNDDNTIAGFAVIVNRLDEKHV